MDIWLNENWQNKYLFIRNLNPFLWICVNNLIIYYNYLKIEFRLTFLFLIITFKKNVKFVVRSHHETLIKIW